MQMTFGRVRVPPKNKFRWQLLPPTATVSLVRRTSNYCTFIYVPFYQRYDPIGGQFNAHECVLQAAPVRVLQNGSRKMQSIAHRTVEAKCKFRGTNLRRFFSYRICI